VEVNVVNVVVKMKLPGRADLIKLTGAVPNSRYKPENFPAAVVKDYEHDGEKKAVLVFHSGKVIVAGARSVEEAEAIARDVGEMVRRAVAVEQPHQG
jgi:transcription initiation factor TFIID TATA-box-binding protein